MHRLVEQSCDLAIVFLDPGGQIVRWSGGAAHVFGYEGDEILGRPVGVLFPADDRKAGMDRHEVAVARIAGASEDDRWMQRKDGSLFWATGVLTSVEDESGNVIGFVKVLRNRTDLKEQMDGLKTRVQGLEQSLKRRDIFLSTLSHELRGPLTPLANAVHLIRTTAPRHDTVEHMVKVIERQILVLQRLVDDLLDMTRFEHGKIALELERLTMRGILEAVIEDLHERARSKDHRLALILPEGEIYIDGDRKRLHQVFVNLVTNAIKYTPSGGEIRVTATTEGDEAVTRVEDTGIGIGKDMLPRIFELFTQDDASRRYSEGGLGIGLSLVRNLLSLHGGTVQVRSEGPGKGSEFVARLPLARPAADSPRQ